MVEGFFTLIFVGLVFVFIAAVARVRAWISRRVGDSPVLRQMEGDALRYARIAMLIGVPVAALGLAGWLLTR